MTLTARPRLHGSIPRATLPSAPGNARRHPPMRRPGRAAPLAIALAALLAACGGGEAPPSEATGGAETEVETSTRATAGSTLAKRRSAPAASEQRQFFPPDAAIPADAHQKGYFSRVYNWPLIPLHAVLMPDGRVMSYGTDGTGRQTANFIYDVWDGAGAPDLGHSTLANPTGTDIFCSSQLLLPGLGQVFIAGGDNWTGTGTTNTGNNNSNLFTPAGNTLSRAANMNRPRWYSTSTTLINGETYVQGGSGGTDRPEIRARDGSFRLLTNANTGGLDFMYPRNFVQRDGRVFGYDSAGRMYWIDPVAGTLASVGQFPAQYGSSDASAAMFRPGRILQFGGNSNGAIVIDVSGGGTPVVTPTQSMSSQRRLVNAAILPDGKVLATGGSSVWNELTNVNNTAEIWDPATGQWTPGATGALARLYHSISLLLPDGSVIVGGGGAPGPLNNLNVEIYYPPYLFTAGGQRAARPVIQNAPMQIEIGRNFTLDVAASGGVSRVTMVKTGSVTHSWNMEQRFLDLTFAADGARVTVQAPAHAGEATPGYYMVFAFDAAGVPSEAKIVALGIAANPDPAVVPVLGSPGDQATTLGTPVALSLLAAEPNGDPAVFTASGLPPGLSIDPVTGLITGTVQAIGSYDVTVSLSDGIHVASVRFVWRVTDGIGLEMPALPAPQAVASGGAATFTTSAIGDTQPEYSWDFGDGSPPTAWSTSATASHVYARAGTFVVTVTARDARGNVATRSVVQAVFLPLTPRRPTQSTPIVLETPANAGPRLWVVNPDNDSVTVFDAASRVRLAEVATGSAPRTLALAADGSLWVVNKGSATISVINTATRAVTRTIALPRASQPYGIAMSPTSAHAYVALEGTGQLLKIDTASAATVGTLAVGAHARHVSVAADGASVYVTRFITPPLPGEGTANVGTGAGVGGEVKVVNAASMSLARTVVLRTSDRPDAENQGRGVPNYLGAAAISPDGTQAFVPSKQDNIQRGALRDGAALNFQNTVRAVSSRIDLAAQAEDAAARIDHDNASVASAAAFDPLGVYLFVALETSREVAVIDAHGRGQMLRLDAGRAPQGLAVSPDGRTLYVHNFMDRSVGVYDLNPLARGEARVPLVATLATVAAERLGAQVLQGKQLFYDARDTRLARDRYMSCAACHNDGGHDGRVWDLSSFGEGLRNTISLRGRTGAAGHGRLHWSSNFDEVQDFEGQIRSLAGGSGLMSDAAFFAGTRSQPLGTAKAGQSAELDALAAYLESLSSFANAPNRSSSGALSTAASAGRTVFQGRNCAACHAGAAFTGSGTDVLVDVGTLKPTSGQRGGSPLAGIDIPTLRDVWATAPYLHDGSAATLEAAVLAHRGTTIGATDLANLVAYLREIGTEEAAAPQAAGNGTGLTGRYYSNMTMTGTVRLTRTEAVNFNWGTGRPTTRVGSNGFSARWTGVIIVPATGTYQFQTVSDDGVRVTVNGQRLIDNWSSHSATTDTSGGLNLTAGQRVPVTIEYFENTGSAVMQWRWRTPGNAGFVAVPRNQLAPS